MSGQADDDDDETLNLRIQCRDSDGLARLLELYGPKAKGYLYKHYGDVLCDADIDAAVHQAAERAWEYGHTFDPSKGSLKSWFMKIVQTQAFDIISDKDERAEVEFDLERHDRPDDCDDPIDAKSKARLDALENCIQRLERLQQAIIRADLKSDSVAGAARLAKIHRTSTNSIYVSRSKARENLRKCVNEHDLQRGSKGGKP